MNASTSTLGALFQILIWMLNTFVVKSGLFYSCKPEIGLVSVYLTCCAIYSHINGIFPKSGLEICHFFAKSGCFTP